MDDLRLQLSRMLVFARVVQRGSFAAAARELGLSRSHVSETVAELEAQVGVRLLERTTRALRLTQEGRRFFDRCDRVVGDAEAALADLAESSEAARGTLRVTCSSVVVRDLVAPVLVALARSPGISAELCVDDHRRDLVAEGFDVGVRVGVPADSTFVARFLGAVPDVIVAAPEVARAIDPDDFDAVRALPWIAHSALPAAVELAGPHGGSRALRLDAVLTTNTAESQRALLLAGAGASVAILPLVDDLIAEGRLVRLLPSWKLRTMQVFALMPSARQQPARTRLFVGALVERAAELWGRAPRPPPARRVRT
jgi:DNA-binding transcriptional LysR family regulator